MNRPSVAEATVRVASAGATVPGAAPPERPVAGGEPPGERRNGKPVGERG